MEGFAIDASQRVVQDTVESAALAGSLYRHHATIDVMTVPASKEDYEIWNGVQELRAAARADIQQAHGESARRSPVSDRTLELYSKIIDAVETDREINSD